MNKNEINGNYDLTITEAILMSKLNDNTTVENPTSVDTQFGEIIIRKNCVGGFCASILNETYFDLNFGQTASQAFMALAIKLKEDKASRFVYRNN